MNLETYLIFDTETTGLPKKNLPRDHESQPRIIQLAAELTNGKTGLSRISLLVNPGVPITPAASKVHGISDETVQKHGINTEIAIALFDNLARLADCLVAHNAAYDIEILVGEYMRLGMDSGALQKPTVCTMVSSADVCRIPKPERYRRPGDEWKWPTLQESYKALVDPAGFDGEHDAMADVTACRKVLFKLMEEGKILPAV